MTKNEFASIIQKEIDNLNSEYHKIYSEKLPQDHKNIKLRTYYEKVSRLQEMIEYPAYARIQAMSDIEIEDYKNEKMSELQQEINEHMVKLAENNKRILEINDQIAKLHPVYDLGRINDLKTQISYIESFDLNYSSNKAYKSKINSLQQNQKEIRAMSSETIKENISQERFPKIHYQIKHNGANKGEITSLESTLFYLSNDPETMLKIAGAARRYSDEKNAPVILPNADRYIRLSPDIMKKLNNSSNYNSGWHNYDITDMNKFENYVASLEQDFEKTLNDFYNEFSEKKLYGLTGKILGYNSTDVDFTFLREHSNKLEDGILDNLQSIVDKRDKLSKKLFKTKDVQSEIVRLNNTIQDSQSKIYESIVSWYGNKKLTDLGYNLAIDLSNKETYRHDLGKIRESIERKKKEFSELKESLPEGKKIMKNIEANHANNMEQRIQYIENLCGVKIDRKQIDNIIGSLSDINVLTNYIAGISFQRIAPVVEREAQNQANVKEAELKGITLEQLYEEKRRIMEEKAKQQANTQVEDVVHIK